MHWNTGGETISSRQIVHVSSARIDMRDERDTTPTVVSENGIFEGIGVHKQSKKPFALPVDGWRRSLPDDDDMRSDRVALTTRLRN